MQIVHDGTFDLAVGRSRKETAWKNKEFTWSQFLEKIAETHYTAETVSEYMAAKKPRQDEIKDIGGYVGGFLTKGRRKKGSVMHRQLITLDLDFAEPELWETLTMLYGHAMAMYSTHKHTPESPRLRLIIPLDREVPTDEYMAISRRIAGEIGIELFDTTTFEPERLMYWPSTSKDGVYEFQYQDGPWLCADAVLDTYTDWKDTSSWPLSEKVNAIIQRGMAKQGDPTEKQGLVGAFCRAFTLTEAIAEFLPETYLETEMENRFTYAHGSTAMGLIVYEDKYAYSHHGTDPAGGKLCNAFDLVRLHKFGLKDDGVAETTPINKYPSYEAMSEWVSKNKAVRTQIASDRISQAEEDFGGPINSAEVFTVDTDGALEIEEPEVEEDVTWMGKLDADKKGNLASSLDNMVIIMQNDPRFKNKLALDDFSKREVVLSSLPWRKVDQSSPSVITNADMPNIRLYFEKVYGITGAAKIDDAIAITTYKNKFNPVKKYLESCEWDGKKRLDSLFIDYLGAEDSPYTRAVTRKSFTAAVARIFRPGIKFDTVLTLVGKQGIGKSQILNRMGGKWFSDSFSGVGTNQAYEQIQGVWIVEIAELAGLKKAEVDIIKHFISKTTDRFRAAYAEKVEECPRMCIFFATTNDTAGFLKDDTGNRRWWPVVTGVTQSKKDIFVDLTASEVMQLWGEARHYYQQGEKLFLENDLSKAAEEIQKAHTEANPKVGIVRQFLDIAVPADWANLNPFERKNYIDEVRKGEQDDTFGVRRTEVCTAEIFVECFGNSIKDLNAYNTKEIVKILSEMPGWQKSDKRMSFGVYGKQTSFERID